MNKLKQLILVAAAAFGFAAFGVTGSGYTRLAYVESSGEQYIDTGLTFDSTYGFAAVYCMKAPINNQAVCGSRTDSGNTRCLIGSNYSDVEKNTVLYIGWGKTVIESGQKISDSGITTVRVNYLNSGKAVATTNTVSLSSLPNQTRTFSLFAANTADGYLYGYARIYDFRISKDGECIRHFIPVRRTSDSVVGLYDTVNGVFYANGGSGSFIGGPAITDASFERLAYLQSSNGQYIDTGVLFTDSHGYSITWQEVQTIDNSNICGSRSTSGDTRCVLGANGGKTYLGWNTLPISSVTGVSDLTEGTATVNYQNSRTSSVRGTSVSLSSTLADQTASFWLFGGHYAYQANVFSYSRIMAFKMSKESEVIMDLVPARRKTDGTVGFYDQLNGDFYLDESGIGFIEPPREIPEGYVGIDYVESSGTQYINTGVKGASDVAVEIEVYNAHSASSVQVFGSRIGFLNQQLSLSFQAEAESYGYRVCWGTKNADSLSKKTDDAFRTFAFGASRYIFIDGKYFVNSNDDMPLSFASQDFSTTLDLFAFNLNNNGTPHNQAASVRIASLRLFKAGEMVRDFTPMLSLADGRVGLYDRLNGVFYGNSGTGELLMGPATAGEGAVDLLADKTATKYTLADATPCTCAFTAGRHKAGRYRLSFQCRKSGSSSAPVTVTFDGGTIGTVTPTCTEGFEHYNFDISKIDRGDHTLSFASSAAENMG